MGLSSLRIFLGLVAVGSSGFFLRSLSTTVLVSNLTVPAGLEPRTNGQMMSKVADDRMRQSAADVLEAERAEEAARTAFADKQAQLRQILEKKLLTNKQTSFARGANRTQFLSVAIATIKGFAPDAPEPVRVADTVTFHEALAAYQRSGSTRQLATIEDAQQRWDSAMIEAAKISAAMAIKRNALRQWTQAKPEADRTVGQSGEHPVLPAARATPSPHLASSSITQGGVVFGLLLSVGLLWPLFRARRKQTDMLRSLTDYVEATAAGDLSRRPPPSTDPALERLSHGLVRLGSVVNRSENLVYHLAALVEISGDAIVSQNLEGKILSWNKGAQRLYGYAVEEVRGQSIGILSPMDYGFELRQVLERVKAGEKVTAFETLHQAKSGRMVRALVRVAAIYDSLHQVIGVSFCAQEFLVPANPLTDSLQRS